jgi:hypothetical protein
MRDRVRFADQKTLHLIAGFASQERQLLFGFDAFAKDRQPEAMPERHDCARDVGGLGVGIQVGDEGTVDLDLVEGE